MDTLPPYVVANPRSKEVPLVLRAHADAVTFPMNDEDRQAMETLVAKYDAEGTCAGLAAPQIGISKRIIVFATPDTPALRIWRPDLSDVMGKTVWINPEYEGVEQEGFHEDYEGCFSVEGIAGTVRRYKQIRYKAYMSNGEQIVGIVNGYLARLIQHEIDHLNGVLFTDIAKDTFPMEDYRKMREEAVLRGYR
jgi:peptide deformylase